MVTDEPFNGSPFDKQLPASNKLQRVTVRQLI
jgi:hypothetical protein